MDDFRLKNILISSLKLLVSIFSIVTIIISLKLDFSKTIFITLTLYSLTKFVDYLEAITNNIKFSQKRPYVFSCINIVSTIIMFAGNFLGCFDFFKDCMWVAIVINFIFICYYMCLETKLLFKAIFAFQTFE